MNQLSPVLPVDAVEPCIPFWERLGFECVATVPHGDALGFAMLTRGPVTVMYQSHASLADDLPALGTLAGAVLLYVTVDDLDAVIPDLGDAQVVQPVRETFYGTREIAVREPGGHIVAFSQHLQAEG